MPVGTAELPQARASRFHNTLSRICNNKTQDVNPVHTFVLQVDTAPRGFTLYFRVAYNVNQVLVCIFTMVRLHIAVKRMAGWGRHKCMLLGLDSSTCFIKVETKHGL